MLQRIANWKFQTKVKLIAALLFVPLIFLSVQYYLSAAEDVSLARSERLGARYVLCHFVPLKTAYTSDMQVSMSTLVDRACLCIERKPSQGGSDITFGEYEKF